MKIDILFQNEEEFREHPDARKIPSHYWTRLFCTPIDTQDDFLTLTRSRHQGLDAFRYDTTQMGITIIEEDMLATGGRKTYFDVLNVIKHDSEIRDDALVKLRTWVCWLVSSNLPVSEWLRAKECPISLRIHMAILLNRLELARQLVTQGQTDETKLNCEQVATICLVLKNSKVIDSNNLFLTIKNWLNQAADFTADLERLESSKNNPVRLDANSDLLDDINSIVYYFKTFGLYVLNYSNPDSNIPRPRIEIMIDALCNQVRALSLNAARSHDYLSMEVLIARTLNLLELGNVLHRAFSAGDATLFAKMIFNYLASHPTNRMNPNFLSEQLLSDRQFPRKLMDQQLEKGLEWYLWLLEHVRNSNPFDGDNIKKSIQKMLSEARPGAALQSRVDDDNDDNNNAHLTRRPRVRQVPANGLFTLQTPVVVTPPPTNGPVVPNPFNASLLTAPTLSGVARPRSDDSEPDSDDAHQVKRPRNQ